MFEDGLWPIAYAVGFICFTFWLCLDEIFDRRCRIKFGDIEIEAKDADEIEEILRLTHSEQEVPVE